jgi:hypothetical protein
MKTLRLMVTIGRSLVILLVVLAASAAVQCATSHTGEKTSNPTADAGTACDVMCRHLQNLGCQFWQSCPDTCPRAKNAAVIACQAAAGSCEAVDECDGPR